MEWSFSLVITLRGLDLCENPFLRCGHIEEKKVGLRFMVEGRLRCLLISTVAHRLDRGKEIVGTNFLFIATLFCSTLFSLFSPKLWGFPETCQGFPILKNRAMTREKSLNSLINMSIEKTSLAGNIVNAQ